MNSRAESANPESPIASYHLLALFALSLAVNLAAAWFVRQPGYMDAYYYFGGARQLVQGKGFTEPYVWNYLDDLQASDVPRASDAPRESDVPAGLPHPSHLYWMPLASVVASISMHLLGDTFRAAQLPFILLAALLPPLSAALAWRLAGHRKRALAAGLLALFPGYYLTFWPNTDTFALFGLLGAGCLIAAWRGGETGRARWWLLAGLLAGLAHLARADGVLLLVVVAGWSLLAGNRKQQAGRSSFLLPASFLTVSMVYLLAMFPWFLRNYLAVGSPLAPGGAAALWLRNYDELVNLTPPTLATYLDQGLPAILAGKWRALTTNLQTALAVQGMIFLWPFALLGAWRVGRHPLLKLAGFYYAALFVLMTFAFSFPGARGGLLHSGTVALPFVFALAPTGVVAAVEWVAARRPSWNPAVAAPVFMGGAVFLALTLTLLVFQTRVVGANWRQPVWNQADRVYAEIGPQLEASETVVVNNPPGFYYHTGHPAVVIPNGPPADLLAVADRFGARYVVLDANVPAGLKSLYWQEETAPRLRLLDVLEDGLERPVYLYEVLP